MANINKFMLHLMYFEMQNKLSNYKNKNYNLSLL